jgi:hypothetical protein
MVNSIQGISSAVFQAFDDMNNGINNKGKDDGQDKVFDTAKKSDIKNNKNEETAKEDKSAKADFSAYEKHIRSLIGENHI